MSHVTEIPPAPALSTPADHLRALFAGAIALPLSDTGWIRISGEDRVRWLNGMVTNSVAALAPGDGNYNFLLNAQGRIQGTAWVFAEPGHLLLQTGLAQVTPMMALLDRFIIMDDVELTDISAETAGLLLAGPHARSALEECGLAPAPLASLARTELLPWKGEPLRLVSKPGRLFPTWEIWAAPSLLSELTLTLEHSGVTLSHPGVLEVMRLLEGTPKFGVDIRDRELPQETGQTEALHFSKGCYLGQEIVERIRSRGNVNRTFRGFHLTGPLPAPGTSLEANGKSVGELTSVALLPTLPGYPAGLALGLGYIRREAIELGHAISYAGGTAELIALPLTLDQPLPIASSAHPTSEPA